MAEVRFDDEQPRWWPPRMGEPGPGWMFERACLAVVWEGPGDTLDVMVLTADGPWSVVAIPVETVARVLAEGLGDG